MKQEHLVIGGLVIVALGLVILTVRQNRFNSFQVALDNQLITFSQTVAEKLGIESLATPATQDTGA